MEGYITSKQAAKKWGITPRRVQIMCANGLIPGASRFGKVWAIPENVDKPTDGRVTTGEYKNWRTKTNSLVQLGDKDGE